MQRSSSSSIEPTSRHFVANLGALDPAVEERLQRWAATSCEEHALRRHEDGSLALYAVKRSAKTARQYQTLLRTLSSHWRLPFGKLERGWLSLLGEGEYRAAVRLPGAAVPGTSPSATHAPQRRLRPRGPPAREVHASLCAWFPLARRWSMPESWRHAWLLSAAGFT